MTKLLAAMALVILSALLACSSSDPTPSPARATATGEPTATQQPTALPTATAEPTQASPEEPSETPTAGAIPGTGFSQDELDCIGEDAARIAGSVTGRGPVQATDEEKHRLMSCLGDDTIAAMFMASIVPSADTLSEETTACTRTAFEYIDPGAAMGASAGDDVLAGMAAGMTMLMVTAYCMNDEEFDQNAHLLNLTDEVRAQVHCVAAELGGAKELAEAMTTAQRGNPTAMVAATETCGVENEDPEPTPDS